MFTKVCKTHNIYYLGTYKFETMVFFSEISLQILKVLCIRVPHRNRTNRINVHVSSPLIILF